MIVYECYYISTLSTLSFFTRNARIQFDTYPVESMPVKIYAGLTEEVAVPLSLFDQKIRTGLYSEIFQKDKIPYVIKIFNMEKPSQKKFFDQNENLCETSRKSLRTNFDVSLIMSKIKESKKDFKKSKQPTTTLSIFT
jgi:hypothetical protein